MRSFADLTVHLKARADDNRAAPVFWFLAALPRFREIPEMSSLGEVLRLLSN